MWYCITLHVRHVRRRLHPSTNTCETWRCFVRVNPLIVAWHERNFMTSRKQKRLDKKYCLLLVNNFILWSPRSLGGEITFHSGDQDYFWAFWVVQYVFWDLEALMLVPRLAQFVPKLRLQTPVPVIVHLATTPVKKQWFGRERCGQDIKSKRARHILLIVCGNVWTVLNAATFTPFWTYHIDNHSKKNIQAWCNHRNY